MKTLFKKLLLGGLIALLIGGILFTVAFAASGFNFEKLSGLVWEEKTFTSSTYADSVVIDVDNADITVNSDKSADEITVSYFVCENRRGKKLKTVNVAESGGSITLKEKTRWEYNLFLWDYKDTDVIVTIPADREVSLDLTTDNGDVKIRGAATLKNIRIDTDNGDTEFVGNITAKNIMVDSDNGDVEIDGNLMASTLTVETDNGTFEAEGNVTVNALSIETDNGNIDAEDALIKAQVIHFITDNGDIDANLFGSRDNYKITVDTDNGDSNLENTHMGNRELYIETDNGDAYISFSKSDK